MKTEKLEKVGNFRIWRFMTNLWTVIFFISIVYDFFTHGVLNENHVILGVAAIYTALLAIYSAEKEFRRWHNMHNSIHPGEFYAILWTILAIALVVGNVFYNPEYHMPPEVTAAYIAVIGILAITRESKNFYKRRHHSGNKKRR